MENLRIAMIGASGSGKTSFMSGLVHHFVDRKRENGGFGIEPVGKNAMEDVTNLFDIATVVQEGRFPDGSRDSTHFKFNFLAEDRGICTFDWMDYRGGAVEEALDSASETPADFAEIRWAIDQSPALVFFIDALQLTQYESNLAARKNSGIGMVNRLMTILGLDYRNTRELTILFVLTKVDAAVIHSEWRKNSYEPLMERAKKLLEPSLDVATRFRWKCGMVATGVVGVGHVETKILSRENGRINFKNSISEDTDPEPFNQNAALFYLLGSVLTNLCKQQATEEARIRQEVDLLLEAQKKQGLGGRLNQWLKGAFGGVTREQIIKIKITEASALRSALLSHEYNINKMFQKSMENIRVLTPW